MSIRVRSQEIYRHGQQRIVKDPGSGSQDHKIWAMRISGASEVVRKLDCNHLWENAMPFETRSNPVV
jgi:hypothetical protein